jgi:hypothetical protein
MLADSQRMKPAETAFSDHQIESQRHRQDAAEEDYLWNRVSGSQEFYEHIMGGPNHHRHQREDAGDGWRMRLPAALDWLADRQTIL